MRATNDIWSDAVRTASGRRMPKPRKSRLVMLTQQEVDELRAKAKERDAYMAAAESMRQKHVAMLMMAGSDSDGYARGWLQYADDFGQAILDNMKGDK